MKRQRLQMMILRTFMASLVTLYMLAPCVEAQEEGRVKSSLKILLVGHDPKNPYVNYEPTRRMVALHSERSAAFEKLLKQHFKTVRVVYANQYQVAMSDTVGVTVFDAAPKPLLMADGKTRFYDLLLPESFAKPALMIGETSAQIGQGSRLKLDWL